MGSLSILYCCAISVQFENLFLRTQLLCKSKVSQVYLTQGLSNETRVLGWKAKKLIDLFVDGEAEFADLCVVAPASLLSIFIV
jgi:hypothetical protein